MWDETADMSSLPFLERRARIKLTIFLTDSVTFHTGSLTGARVIAKDKNAQIATLAASLADSRGMTSIVLFVKCSDGNVLSMSHVIQDYLISLQKCHS